MLAARLLDEGAEWRTFANDDRAGGDGAGLDKSRVGAVEDGLLDGGGLATAIDGGRGRAARGSVRALHAATSLSARDRALLGEYERIGTLADGLGLPGAVADVAKALLKRGRDAEAGAAAAKRCASYEAAAVLLACRRAGVARSMREIVIAVNREDVTLKSLNACLERLKAAAGGAPGVSLEALVGRLAGALRLSQAAEMVAVGAAAALRDAAPAKRLESIAAAAVWLASRLGGEARELRAVAHAAGLAEATVRGVREALADALVRAAFPAAYLAAAAAAGRRVEEALLCASGAGDSDTPG